MGGLGSARRNESYVDLLAQFSPRINMFGACTCLKSEWLDFMKGLSWFKVLKLCAYYVDRECGVYGLTIRVLRVFLIQMVNVCAV